MSVFTRNFSEFVFSNEITFLNKLRVFKRSSGLALEVVEKYIVDHKPAPLYSDVQINNLIKTSRGLHEHLNKKTKLKFSILIPVYKPNLKYFSEALDAALNQSSPNFEILVGFDGEHSSEYQDLIDIKNQKNLRSTLIQIKYFTFERTKESYGISVTTNKLANLATGDWLVLFDHDDWIRPDLLYRYEQTLQLFNLDKNIVLYCNEYKIDEKSNYIPGSILEKPFTPEFPILFINWVCHCLAVPKELWITVGGLQQEYDGAQDYELVLRLDIAGAKFSNVPFLMYAWRSHSGSTASNLNQKPEATSAGINALSRYAEAKGLNWKILEGPFPTAYRARPELIETADVHVIVPFKDQRELTLSCVKSLLNQKNINLFITFVNNQSVDAFLSQELSRLGIEVLNADFPFNFSKLNNFAIKDSQCPSKFDLVLFLNNDVVLNDDAIFEMACWATSDYVGAVGAQLLYPDGRIQHGGIRLDDDGKSRVIPWIHASPFVDPKSDGIHNVIQTMNCVTAACMMMKKSLFQQVDGFDEDFYPIAFSDTLLCMKIRELGFSVLYTPYAKGVHYESLTRGKDNIEDYESSTWLHHLYFGSRSIHKLGPFYPMLSIKERIQ